MSQVARERDDAGISDNFVWHMHDGERGIYALHCILFVRSLKIHTRTLKNSLKKGYKLSIKSF